MTRNRYRKLCRALNAAIGHPEFCLLSDNIRIMPETVLSYALLWEPMSWVAAQIGLGEKNGKPNRSPEKRELERRISVPACELALFGEGVDRRGG